MTSHDPNRTGDGSAEARAQNLREQVSARLGDAQEATDTARREISEAAKRTSDEGTRFVREHPGLALAGALGVGVLIGLAFRGRP